MPVKSKRRNFITRRVFILGAIKTSLFAAIISRLYWLQIVQSDKYKTYSDSNRIRMTLIPPLRGKILDRNGLPLAINQNYYRILFDPTSTNKRKEIIERVAKLLKLDEENSKIMLKKAASYNSITPLLLYEHLSWSQVAAIEVNMPDLPGVSIELGQRREYTMHEISPHILGYLGPVTQKEIKINPLLNHPDFKIGNHGIEELYENMLRGQAGIRKMEVNAFGLAVNEISRIDAISGKDLKLSLDKKLQEYASKRLDGLSASVVVMDVNDGSLLCVASSPGFDPNRFSYKMTNNYWQKLRQNTKKPLINKALANQYPPGSTFKLVVALAALKEGIDPNINIHCNGYMYLGRVRFGCWRDGGHGSLDMMGAIMHSCNIYFYNLAKKIGVEKIAQMAKNLGLGEVSSLDLPGEKPGLVPNSSWKKNKFKIPWQMGDTLNVGIGQGYVLSTNLQLAKLGARIASGKQVEPKITLDENKNDFSLLDIEDKHLKFVQEGMRRVVNVAGGTAYGSRIISDKYSMVGKTGTSQIVSKKSRSILSDKNRDLGKNHALFVGFGPVENPRYSISVIVEHGGSGSAAAAPVARDILTQAFFLADGGQISDFDNEDIIDLGTLDNEYD